MLIQAILLTICIVSLLNAEESSQTLFQIPDKYMDGLTEGKLHLEKQKIHLHYVTNGLEESSELLVFYHGFPQFWYTWRHQLQYFKKKYTVYAFDLRGFGLSDRPNGVLNYTIDQQMEDMAETIQMLKAQPENANKRVTMVCHDIGTAVGAMMNYHYPDLVDRLVMINAPNPRTLSTMFKNKQIKPSTVLHTPYFYKILAFQIPHGGEHVVQGNNFKFFDDIWIDGKDKPIIHQGPDTFDRTDLEVYKRAYSQPNAVTSALNFYRAPLQAAFVNTWKKILSLFMSNNPKKELPEKIKAKCLVLWGIHDAAFGVEYGEAARDACEHGELVELDSSHWVPEDVPDEVNTHIEQFLQKEFVEDE